ncbi:MAG: TonB family protein [Opitutales bacterium]|nr:TonB family protein [Opitutales bacterium]
MDMGRCFFVGLVLLALSRSAGAEGAWPGLTYELDGQEWSVHDFDASRPVNEVDGESKRLPRGGVFRLGESSDELLAKAFLPPRMAFSLGPRGRPADEEDAARATVSGWSRIDVAWVDELAAGEEAEGGIVALAGLYAEGSAVLKVVPLRRDPDGERAGVPLHSMSAPAQPFGRGMPVIWFYRKGEGFVDASPRHGEAAPLLRALLRNDSEEVTVLLAAGADPNAGGPDGWSPVHAAATFSNEAAMTLLRSESANPRATDSERFTPLHYAASRGNVEAARILLDRRARVNASSRTNSIPLFIAVGSSPPELVELLMENGARTTGSGRLARNCPTLAMINELRDDLADLFIEHGQRFRFVRENADWVFASRLRNDRLGIVRYFVERTGQSVSEPVAGEYPVVIAAENGSVELVEYLVAQGASLEADLAGGFTLMHIAAASNPPLVGWLAEQGIEPEARADNGATPMASALAAGNVNGVLALLKAGADPNSTDHQGEHILWLATRLAQREAVKTLVAAGAECEFTEETALDLMEDAFRYDIPEVFEITLAQCLAPDFEFSGGFPGWGVAEHHGAARIMEVMVERGLPGEARRSLRLAAPSDLDAPLRPLATPMVAYPYELQRRYGGRTVILDLVIDGEGRIRFPVVAEGGGIPELEDKILDYLRFWRFEPPGLPEGVPGVRARLPIRFEADVTVFETAELSSPPRPVHQPAPMYPPSMLRIGLAGTVETRFIVGPDGLVREEDIQIISTPHPDFANAVREAVANWEFEAGLKDDGQPAAARIGIRFPFNVRSVDRR